MAEVAGLLLFSTPHMLLQICLGMCPLSPPSSVGKPCAPVWHSKYLQSGGVCLDGTLTENEYRTTAWVQPHSHTATALCD